VGGEAAAHGRAATGEGGARDASTARHGVHRESGTMFKTSNLQIFEQNMKISKSIVYSWHPIGYNFYEG
jgi:hypothetical protein